VRFHRTQFLALALALLGAKGAYAQETSTQTPQTAPASQAPPLIDSGRLLLTQGVSNIEGAAGGGLATWAVISGYETRDAVGGNVHATYVNLPGYTLQDYGVSVGLFDRIEISYTREIFNTGSTGGKLGLGDGFTFDQDVVGAKVSVAALARTCAETKSPSK
jgi:hypothetical protein